MENLAPDIDHTPFEVVYNYRIIMTPRYQAKREKYLDARGTGMSKKEACIIAGLSHNAPNRIHKLYMETASTSDRPRSGRPVLYTDTVLSKCYDALVAEPGKHFSTTEFFNHVKDAGLLHAGASKRHFLESMGKWARRNDISIDFYSTLEEFEIQSGDEPLRVEYAKHMLDFLKANPNARLVFIDETTVEHGGHPKAGV